MQIGSFAGLVFEVSDRKILAPSEISRGGGARWAVHDINQQKPLPEYIGPGQETYSYKILLKRTHGVDPHAVMEKLRKFRNTGQVSTLIIGSRPVTNGQWYLDDAQENHRQVAPNGVVLTIEATLNLKEYPKEKPIRNKPKATTPGTGTPTKKGKETGVMTVKVKALNLRTSPSLKGKVKTVMGKNDSYKVYGTVEKEGITWYVLGGGLYASAEPKYSTFKKK